MPSDTPLIAFFEETGAACVHIISTITDDPSTLAPLERLREDARRAGITTDAGEFERALLSFVAVHTEPRIASLPVHESVQQLLRDEIRYYKQPNPKAPLQSGSHAFVAACKIVSLRRFPAGPLDWELSGMPRSWLAQSDKRQLLRLTYFLASRMGGLRPMFFIHVARRPKNRGLLIEKEVMRAYYRMARSLELQPEVKGIMASAWFHDPAAVAENPHLAALNRPYLEAGGLIVTRGRADQAAGFLEHNAERQQQFESGDLKYRLATALWPRQAAIRWARAHPELEAGA